MNEQGRGNYSGYGGDNTSNDQAGNNKKKNKDNDEIDSDYVN